ncbi:MAG: hypothetical protein WBQ73_03475 [Candidatus Babeliales bacterium]
MKKIIMLNMVCIGLLASGYGYGATSDSMASKPMSEVSEQQMEQVKFKEAKKQNAHKMKAHQHDGMKGEEIDLCSFHSIVFAKKDDDRFDKDAVKVISKKRTKNKVVFVKSEEKNACDWTDIHIKMINETGKKWRISLGEVDETATNFFLDAHEEKSVKMLSNKAHIFFGGGNVLKIRWIMPKK